MKALLIIGTIPLWPLLLIMGIPYGAMRCMVRLQTGSWEL
jgi:hypothetical protein